jgi:hypothetical protein
MSKDKKYFCYEIYKNLSVWSNNGFLEFNPCSFYQGNYHRSETFDLDKVWNGSGRQKLIDMINSDTAIPGCNTCYEAERHGLISRRMSAKNHYENFNHDFTIDLESPQGLDYSVGNLCNLKCVICGPKNSSQWMPDYIKLYPKKNVSSLKFDKHNQIKITDKRLLQNIKTLHFHGGGEPLLSDSHQELLQIIDEQKGLSDVRVFYNTNGTTTVGQDVLDLWEKCFLVELYFSIDDIGKRFDYQRTGFTWSALEDNLKWFYENMPHNHMFNINCTWSYLNFYYLNELYRWYESKLRTNRYGDPVNFILQKAIGDCALNHITPETKDILQKRFSDFPALLMILDSLSVNDDPHDKFWSYIDSLDNIRTQNFRSLCFEWSQLIS